MTYENYYACLITLSLTRFSLNAHKHKYSYEGLCLSRCLDDERTAAPSLQLRLLLLPLECRSRWAQCETSVSPPPAHLQRRVQRHPRFCPPSLQCHQHLRTYLNLYPVNCSAAPRRSAAWHGHTPAAGSGTAAAATLAITSGGGLPAWQHGGAGQRAAARQRLPSADPHAPARRTPAVGPAPTRTAPYLRKDLAGCRTVRQAPGFLNTRQLRCRRP